MTMEPPWVEVAITAPLAGAAALAFVRDRAIAYRICLGFTIAVLAASLMAWFELAAGIEPSPSFLEAIFGRTLFRMDRLNAPLIAFVALIHVLTVMTTARTKASRFSFAGALTGETVRLGSMACVDPWPLIALLVLGTLLPLVELVRRGKPVRVYAIHMAAFAVLLAGGWRGTEAGEAWGPFALLLAILLRCGAVPLHLWIADLFEHDSFGNSLLFSVPLIGVYAAVRLVLPAAPDWMLDGIGVASLVTALYAACMASIQREARRFFAYFFLSHASLVLIGLELHTTLSLAGCLYLWMSVTISLAGLGLTLRALEARYGRLSLTHYRGLYDQSPTLAICFLLTGLASVGFPGTIGFVAAELLMDGAVGTDLAVGAGLILAAAVNGIAIVRVYFLLFTGARHESAASLGVTQAERFAILTLVSLILAGGLLPQPGVADRHAAAAEMMKTRRVSK
jgi:NADH-quinone oxidoreductase subunit M